MTTTIEAPPINDDIYRPTGSHTLDTVDEAYLQLRLGIQGPFKSGKTFSALSFPNPIVISFDRGLVSHIGRADVIEVPFYSDAFVDKLAPRASRNYTDLRDNSSRVTPPNKKDALLKWLNTEAQKLKRKQTLVVDGSTGIQAAYHLQYWTSPKLTREGDVDSWGEWNWKIGFFTEIAMVLKSLTCNVIYIAHETPDRNKEGNLTGLNRPLLSGQFGDELGSHFTDWFRAITTTKPSPDKYDDFKKAFNIDQTTMQEWIQSTPKEHQTIYLWQTQSDKTAACGTSLVNAPKYILANASSFNKYKRQETK